MAGISKGLHSRFNLYTTPEAYFLEPTSPTGTVDVKPNQILSFNRVSGDVGFNVVEGKPRYTNADYSFPVFGVMGIVSLVTTDFLILITARSPHGRIGGHTIYRARGFKLLPLSPATLRKQQHPAEKKLLHYVNNHLTTGVFWFSYGWDLTTRLQGQVLETDKHKGKELWEMADDRFFWNKYLQSRFIAIATSAVSPEINRFILPVLYGSFDIRQAQIGSKHFQFCLISRRSRYRAGTRYFARGVDAEGHAANFNETEQILLPDEDRSDSSPAYGAMEGRTRMSFVQTRGSMPFFWAEVNTLRYIPDLQIMETEGALAALKLHLSEQVALYGTQYLVNLVNSNGREKHVKEAYERSLQESKLLEGRDVNYQYFDYHTECSHMRHEKISLLIDKLHDGLISGGYFHQDLSQPTPLKVQTAVVRTNCMDCLDRTNVCQAALGRFTLTQQLRATGILGASDAISQYEEFDSIFRNVWADHADYVSNAYAGSGALKTDFTRTGKRSHIGKWHDFRNGAIRYLKNNYFDGARQDAFDIITGTWTAKKNPASLISVISDLRPLYVQSMPYVLGFSMFMLFASVSLPRTSTYSFYYYNIFWLFLVTISFIFILVHGLDYVAWPRLNPPTDTIYYEGPGYKTSPKHGTGFTIPPWIANVLKKRGVRVPRKVRVGLGHRYRLSSANEIEMGTKKRVD